MRGVSEMVRFYWNNIFILGFLLAFIGMFLPWANIVNRRMSISTTGLDSNIGFIIIFILLGTIILFFIKSEAKGISATVGGGATFFIAGYSFFQAKQANDLIMKNSVYLTFDFGIFVVLIGSAIMTLTGIVLLRRRTRSSINETLEESKT